MSACVRDVSWVGVCGRSAEGDPPLCPKHADDKCWCGSPAVKDCEVTGSFVCGRPLCAEHECPSTGLGYTGTMPHSSLGRRQYEAWQKAQS